MKTATADNIALGTWGQPGTARETKLQTQCRQFESVLTNEVLKAMRKTVPETKGWFGESSGERSFRDMFYQQLSDVLAKRGALAVGREVYDKVRLGLGADSQPTPLASGQSSTDLAKKPGVLAAFTQRA